MGIRAALDKIVIIQGNLTITEPTAMSIKKAWKLAPPANVKLPDYPAFVNSWSVALHEPGFQSRLLRYRVNMQLLVAPITVDSDVYADAATAFWEAMLTAFGQDITLGGAVSLATLRGGEPTLAQLDRPAAGESFVGINAILDIEHIESFAYG